MDAIAIAVELRQEAARLTGIADLLDPPDAPTGPVLVRPAPAALRAPDKRSRGRKPGPVREGVLAAIGEQPVAIDDIRAHLAAIGVKTSDGNLHQQLRRLTQSGHVQRLDRGRYRLAA